MSHNTYTAQEVVAHLYKHRNKFYKMAQNNNGTDSADDILQDIAVHIIKKGTTTSYLDSFLYTCIMNRKKSEYNKDIMLKERHFQYTVYLNDTLPEEKLTLNKEKIQKYINKLPEKQKKVLTLMTNGLSYAQISRKINSPYDTVKANYLHGLKKLKSYIAIDKLSVLDFHL